MRPITVTLLSTCAVCALAQGHHAALAQPDPNPNPNPSPTSPAKPTDPPLPTNTDPTSPMDPQLPPSEPSPPANPEPTEPSNPPLPPSTPPPPPADTTSAPATPPPPEAEYSSSEGPDMYSYAWTDHRLPSGIGISTILGGGVTGFTDKTMRNTTSSVGGLWDLRVTIGSHIPLAFDVSYVGTATNINGLFGGRSGTLLGTTFEGAARFNMLPHFAWNPYVFGGVGWQHYDVTRTNVTLSDSGMNDKDTLLEFPLGVGVAYRTGGFVIDVRGTFRIATDQDLVLKNPAFPSTIAPTTTDFAAMDTWEASAAVGYEF